MRKALLIVALLAASDAFADSKERIAQGIGLHELGRYDDAIAVFKSVLADEPANDDAAYELAMSYMAKGDAAQCRAAIEPRLDHKTDLQAAMHAIAGNCLDMAGKTDEAIATYRKGLAINANETQILFNLALTLAQHDQYDEARELLKKELPLRPDHRTARYVLAEIFSTQNFRAPAVVEYLRFLSLEPSGPRAKEVAGKVLTLINAGVERKSEKETTITIDPNARTEEGDYGVWNMMMAVAGAAGNLPETKKLSEFERAQSQLSDTIKMFAEANEAGSNYTTEHNLPFFVALYDKKLVEAFAGVALTSLNLKGQDAWLKKNAKAVQSYQAFMAGQK